MSFTASFSVASAFDRLLPILNGLSTAVFGWRMSPTMGEEMSRLIVARVMNLAAVLRAIVTGTLRVRRSPAPGLRRKPAATKPGLRLPRQFGWLLPILQPTAAIYGSYLAALLAEPEMAALLASSPRVVRAMRTVCRMLGVVMPKVAAPVEAQPVEAAPVAADGDMAAAAPRVREAATDGPCAASSSVRPDGIGLRKNRDSA